MSHKSVIAGNILKMLSYTESLPITEIDTADIDTEEFEFFEVFVWLFAKNLAELIKSNQVREYVKRSEDLHFVRGRIDTRRSTDPARLHIVPCIFHEFSKDNTLNRTLKYTCHLMSRMIRGSENFRLLRFISNVLEPVNSRGDSGRSTGSVQPAEPADGTVHPDLPDISGSFYLTLRASHVETFSSCSRWKCSLRSSSPGCCWTTRSTISGSKWRSSPGVDRASGRTLPRKKTFRLIPDITIRNGAATAIIDVQVLNHDDSRFDVKQPDIPDVCLRHQTPASSAMLLP